MIGTPPADGDTQTKDEWITERVAALSDIEDMAGIGAEAGREVAEERASEEPLDPLAGFSAKALASMSAEEQAAYFDRLGSAAAEAATEQARREGSDFVEPADMHADPIEAFKERLDLMDEAGSTAAEAQRQLLDEGRGELGDEGEEDLDLEEDKDEIDASVEEELAEEEDSADEEPPQPVLASELYALNQLVQGTGDELEADGRTRFDTLSDKAVRGIATPAERQALTDMTVMRGVRDQLVKPTADLFHHIGDQRRQEYVNATFHAAVDHVATERGLSQQIIAALRSASYVDLVDAFAERLQGNAQPRRQSVPPSAKRSDIAEPQRARDMPRPARVRVNTPNHPQVLSGGRPTPVSTDRRGGRALPSYAYGDDGFPTERFEREVKAGKWLGADV